MPNEDGEFLGMTVPGSGSWPCNGTHFNGRWVSCANAGCERCRVRAAETEEEWGDGRTEGDEAPVDTDGGRGGA